MDENGFRKAQTIELHDSGIVISHHKFSGEGWYGYSDETPDEICSAWR